VGGWVYGVFFYTICRYIYNYIYINISLPVSYNISLKRCAARPYQIMLINLTRNISSTTFAATLCYLRKTPSTLDLRSGVWPCCKIVTKNFKKCNETFLEKGVYT